MSVWVCLIPSSVTRNGYTIGYVIMTSGGGGGGGGGGGNSRH